MTTPPDPRKHLNKEWLQALAEAKAIALPETLWQQRPQVQGVTIDGPTSRDLDDAIHVEATSTGAIASIHIADVAELVTIDSTLDKVALARTQTRYLSRGNIPMLPLPLSADKLSLLEGKPRPTMTIQVTLNHQAEIQTTEIFESWIVSAKRFSYEQADRVCEKSKNPFHEMMQLCQSWAERLNQERRNQGAIGGFFNALGFWVDENGAVLIPDGRLFKAQMIIQEFMILANRAVAHWFAKRDVLALYRNHTARTIAPEREQIMQALLTTGSTSLIRQKLQNWLDKAEYNPNVIGHFALNLPAYCHVTSPIRRLADLLNHRILKALIHQQPHPYRKFELEQICTYITAVNKADDAATKKSYKQSTRQKHQKQLQKGETTAFATLTNKEFCNIVNHAVKEDNVETIQAAAKQRLEQDRLSIKSLYLLLVHSADLALQQHILAKLKQRPEDATSVLDLATQQEPDWEQLTHVEADEDDLPFWLWAEVSIAGQATTTKEPAHHQRKQNARHLASLKWLEAFVSDNLVSPAQRQQPESSVVTTLQVDDEPGQQAASVAQQILPDSFADDQNFVGRLQEISQSLGLALPAYQVTGKSSDFICICRILVHNETFQAKGAALQKKKAKQIAAKETLTKLQRRIEHNKQVEMKEPTPAGTGVVVTHDLQTVQASVLIPHPILASELIDGQNFIGLLQQLCQTLDWEFPTYEFEGEAPEFVCTCTLWAGEQRYSGKAISSKKKKAKYFATKIVLLSLQRAFQSS